MRDKPCRHAEWNGEFWKCNLRGGCAHQDYDCVKCAKGERGDVPEIIKLNTEATE